MENYILIIVLVILLCNNNKENATFTTVSPAPNYPLSYIHGVRIGRKVFDPNYHDPAIYRTPNQHLGPD
jgi:hypothetical protein